MPGNAKVLLIWLGISGRPVANTATASASLGSSSGFGMPSANTTGSAFIPATSSRDSDPGYDTPTYTSAPFTRSRMASWVSAPRTSAAPAFSAKRR